MADNNEIKTTLTVETDNASVNKARGAFRALGDDIDALAKAQDEYAKKAKQVADEANQASDKIASAGSKARQRLDKDIDTLTSSAGGLGKLQAGLGSLSSLSDGLDVGNIIGAADGVANFAEGLGSLPNLLGNLTSGAGAAAIALGLATAALAQVFNEANKQAEAIGTRIDARREALQFASGGGTVEDAQQRVATLQAQADAERALLAELEQQYREFESQAGLLTPIAQAFFPQEEELANQISQSREAIQTFEESQRAYQALLEDNALATGEAVDALEDVPPALDGVTQSANEAREKERELAEERRKAEKVAEEARRAEEARAKAIQDLNNKILDVAQKRADSEEDLARQLSDNQSDARRKLNNDLKSLDKKARDETTKAVQSFQSNEAKVARDHQRNLTKIVEDANRQREELERNLDFSGLFDLETNTNQALSDAEAQFDAERQERQIAFDTQFRDLKLSLSDERQARNQAFRDELADISRNADRARREKNIAFDRELRDAQVQYDRMYGVAQNGLKRIGDEIGRVLGGGQSRAGAGGPSLSGVPTASRGGIGFAPTSNQSIFSRSSTNNTNNNGSFTFNINGGNTQDVARVVQGEIRKIFG